VSDLGACIYYDRHGSVQIRDVCFHCVRGCKPSASVGIQSHYDQVQSGSGLDLVVDRLVLRIKTAHDDSMGYWSLRQQSLELGSKVQVERFDESGHPASKYKEDELCLIALWGQREMQV
jgi:hypothetical protein